MCVYYTMNFYSTMEDTKPNACVRGERVNACVEMVSAL